MPAVGRTIGAQRGDAPRRPLHLADARVSPATGLCVIKTHLPADAVSWPDDARCVS